MHIVLRKVPTSDDLQTYLKYCTHLKVTTRKLQSWRAGSSYCLSLQVFTTVCSSSDLVGVFLLYVSEGVDTS
jgi:hypothetical protein